MGHLFDMEWNTKWDWDNYGAFGPSKPLESPKKMQQQQQQSSEWMMVDDGDIDARSFNLSTGAGVSNWNVSSSSKSSLSASTETSAKYGTSNFKLMTFNNCLKNTSKKGEIIGSEISGNSPPFEASVGSVEPSIALELGKRTFFDNSVKTPPSSCLKKPKSSSSQNVPTPRCLVEGCNSDLAVAKEYHRKHRVCDTHSKSPKVIIRGLEHRFCQQCSRFHNISEFDEKKRSCRKRLSEHNARRRKPPPETIRFNSAGFSPSFYGTESRQQETSFLLNNTLLLQPRNTSSSLEFNTKFTITKGPSPKYEGDGGGHNEQFHMFGVKTPQRFIDIHGGKSNGGLIVSNNNMPKVSNPGGSKGNLMPSQFNADVDGGRALSLLSTTTNPSPPWISSTGQQSIIVNMMMQEDYNSSTCNNNNHQQLMQSIPEGVPLRSPPPPELWLSSSRSHTNHRSHQLVSFQESHHLIGATPHYEAGDFYSNILN